MERINNTEQAALEQELLTNDPQYETYLVDTGVVGDKQIKNPQQRETRRKKKQYVYHNTQLLLEHYQTIVWVIQSFPDMIAQELNAPMERTDYLLEQIDLALCLENRRLENQFRAIARTKMLIDRVNEALTMNRSKPGNGEEMYQVIYQTYIQPDYIDIPDLVGKLALSKRRYYSLRDNAFRLISLILWSGPNSEVARLVEILAILEDMRRDSY